MELVIALSIIFSVVALSIAIYTGEELMKLRYSTQSIIDLVQDVLNNNHKMIEYIEALENRISKED